MIKDRQIDLLIATTNGGKIREIKHALRDLPLRFRLLREFGEIQTVNEVGSDYEENARLKALDYSRQAGFHSLADDSGLEVDALGGLPGFHSACYGGPGLSIRQRTERLLAALEKVEIPQRSARFICVMVLARPSPESNEKAAVQCITRGVCEGGVARTLRGSNGFGYDPLFVPAGFQETFGQLPSAIKNRISHRAQALSMMRSFIEAWIARLDRESGGP